MSRWENIGDKYLLNSLGDDPLAASQSVAMYLDPIAKCIEWHTNGHVIRMRPDLPSAILSGPFPTSFGYEWNLAGGIVFGVGDVSLTKRAGVLDSWGLEGVQLYYIVPVGQIPNTPTVNIEKIDILDGMIDSMVLGPQGVLSAQEIAAGASRSAPWVDNSMVMSWAGRRNNNASDNHSNYMVGKILQKAPPLAHPLVCPDLQAGNQANRSFGAANGSETTGWYDVLPGGFQKAYNRQDLVDNRGVGTHYAFAATLGYTSVGGTSFNSTSALFFAGGWQATEDGTVTNISFGFENPAGLPPRRVSIYTGLTPSGLLYDNTNLSPDSTVGSPNGFATWDVAGGPSLTNGTYYGPAAGSSSAHEILYDTSGGPGFWRQTGVILDSAPPDPVSPSSLAAGYAISGYLTYTVGGGSIIPQIMHNRQLQRRR